MAKISSDGASTGTATHKCIQLSTRKVKNIIIIVIIIIKIEKKNKTSKTYPYSPICREKCHESHRMALSQELHMINVKSRR